MDNIFNLKETREEISIEETDGFRIVEKRVVTRYHYRNIGDGADYLYYIKREYLPTFMHFLHSEKTNFSQLSKQRLERIHRVLIGLENPEMNELKYIQVTLEHMKQVKKVYDKYFTKHRQGECNTADQQRDIQPPEITSDEYVQAQILTNVVLNQQNQAQVLSNTYADHGEY